MKWRACFFISVLLNLPATSCAWAQSWNFQELSGDITRSELGRLGAEIEEPGTRGIGPKFNLPSDGQDGVTYGIDVSHHNFKNGRTIDWNHLPKKKVSFVYMKATQGDRFLDRTLQSSWRAAERSGVLRGTYHFLSADVDAERQARAFVASQREVVDYKTNRDLPPVLDIEWDLESHPVPGAKVPADRWRKYSRAEILAKANVWLAVVRKELGVEPLVYSNAQWWKSVGLEGAALDGDPKLWIADYSKRANAKQTPRTPGGKSWLIWQFTDSVSIDGFEYDGNLYRKDLEGLLQELNRK